LNQQGAEKLTTVTVWSQEIEPLEGLAAADNLAITETVGIVSSKSGRRKEAKKEAVMVTVKQQKLDSKTWRENASRFRQCAKLTREAERQRIFPALADECETRAKELEQLAEKRSEPANAALSHGSAARKAV
jgi:hypothetical protein